MEIGFGLGLQFAQRRVVSGGIAPIETILIDGDSNTSSTPSTDNNSWAYNWSDAHPGVVLAVRAQGSRVVGTSANLNDNGNSLFGNVAENVAYGANVIGYMIGTNDFTTGNDTTYRTNLTNLYNAYKAADPSVLIAWSPPPFPNPTGTPHPNYATILGERADLLVDCRDPAVWGQWADYYVPLGEYPDFGDAALAAPLFGDSVHFSAAGHTLMQSVAEAVFGTILDETKVNSTAPYEAVWPVDETNLAISTEIVRRFLLAGLNPRIPHDLSCIGATIRRAGGTYGTSLADCYNGDVIDFKLTTSGSYETVVSPQLTIGSETRTINYTTAANLSPAVYVHGGDAESNVNGGNITHSATVVAGRPVVHIVSYNNRPTAVTFNGVSLVKTTEEAVATEYYRASNRGLQVWNWPDGQANIGAGTYNLDIDRPANSTNHVVMWGVMQNTAGLPISFVGSSPASQSQPHLTTAFTVPANGLALCALLEEGGASITPATANTGTDFVAEQNTTQLGSTAGFILATKDESGQGSFNFAFGTWVRIATVYEAG